MPISALILAKENRVMIDNVNKDIKEIKECLLKISNHYSKRLPIWVTILFTILGSLVVGLIVGVK